jgi:molybdenum cofactor cytidylyltransferase
MTLVIAAIVEAAGTLRGSSRPVALAPWSRITLVEHLVDVVRPSTPEVVVVLGADAEAVLGAVELDGVTLVIDPEWREGAASRVRVGLDTLLRESAADAVVVVDAGHPQVEAGVVATLVRAHAARKVRLGVDPRAADATVPKYRYVRAGPVVVGRELWPWLMNLEGETTVIQALQSHPDWVSEVWIDRLAPATVLTTADMEAAAPRH